MVLLLITTDVSGVTFAQMLVFQGYPCSPGFKGTIAIILPDAALLQYAIPFWRREQRTRELGQNEAVYF